MNFKVFGAAVIASSILLLLHFFPSFENLFVIFVKFVVDPLA